MNENKPKHELKHFSWGIAIASIIVIASFVITYSMNKSLAESNDKKFKEECLKMGGKISSSRLVSATILMVNPTNTCIKQ